MKHVCSLFDDTPFDERSDFASFEKFVELLSKRRIRFCSNISSNFLEKNEICKQTKRICDKVEITCGEACSLQSRHFHSLDNNFVGGNV